MNNKILIVGTDHHNTLGLVESLGQKGIKPYVILRIGHKADWVLKSRYVEKGWILFSDEALIQTMLDVFQDTENKTIVLASSDRLAAFLDRNHETLSPYFILPTVKQAGTLEEWMKKSTMKELATKVGLQTPKTWMIHGNIIPNDIVYPCITKAVSSAVGSKEDMLVCRSEKELKYFLQSQAHCDAIQVSRFIDKAFEFQFLGCSLGYGEEIVISGRTHVDRPNGIDNTFFLRFDKTEPEFKETEDKVREFIRQTGYSGTFSVEFLKGKDGVDYFTEMNFRNDGNAVCQTAAGINIPYIYYLYHSGGDYKKELEQSTVKTIWLMPELFYLQFFFQREFGLKEWWSNMKKANCYTTYFKEDKKPFFAFLKYLAKSMIIKN